VSEQHEVFDIAELDTISVECPQCRTEILFRLDTPGNFGAPCVCPTCRETYAEMGNFLAAYRELFGRGLAIGKKMRVRIRSGSEQRRP
jgi:ssDNA-binding Zn-finger/Zn-ribbon topoisomerase 1